MTSSFVGRRAVIATKHGKERVLAHPLRDELGMLPELLPLDTDRFGTFTGETPRIGSQLDALRAKLRAAREETSHDAVLVASEGSFFPDPHFPQITLDRELVGIYDPTTEIEIVGSAVAPARVISEDVRDADALERALARIGLPEFGAIVHTGTSLHKGLRDADAVRAVVTAAWLRGEPVRIESDVRAHHNPARMRVIAEAGIDAVRRARSHCPGCARPGYWRMQVLPGLPCEECGAATERPRADVWACRACDHREERARDAATASAAHCDACNP